MLFLCMNTLLRKYLPTTMWWRYFTSSSKNFVLSFTVGSKCTWHWQCGKEGLGFIIFQTDIENTPFSPTLPSSFSLYQVSTWRCVYLSAFCSTPSPLFYPTLNLPHCLNSAGDYAQWRKSFHHILSLIILSWLFVPLHFYINFRVSVSIYVTW